MEKLITPFGTLLLFFDNEPILYKVDKLGNDPQAFPNVYERYRICIDYNQDHLPHSISLIVDGDFNGVMTDVASGERLEAIEFCKNDVMMNIGVKGGEFDLNIDYGYDYAISYLKNGQKYSGLRFDILPETVSNTFAFGIAWIMDKNNVNKQINDVELSFAAEFAAMGGE